MHSDVSISLSQAVLGGTIKIAGIYDDILLNVSNAKTCGYFNSLYFTDHCYPSTKNNSLTSYIRTVLQPTFCVSILTLAIRDHLDLGVSIQVWYYFK